VKRTGLLIACLAVFVPALAAQNATGRYIVELTTEPVTDAVSRPLVRQAARLSGGSPLRSTAAFAHRARIRDEQSGVRQNVEQSQGRVLGTVDTVANALFVEDPDGGTGREDRSVIVTRSTVATREHGAHIPELSIAAARRNWSTSNYVGAPFPSG
jgi:hypothetical protein